MKYCEIIDTSCKETLYQDTERVIRKLALFEKKFIDSEEKFITVYSKLERKPKKPTLLDFLLLREQQYLKKALSRRLLKKMNLIVSDLQELHLNYIRSLEQYKVHLYNLPLSRLDKKTIREEFSMLDIRNKAIMQSLNTGSIPDFNSYVLAKKRIAKIVLSQIELLYSVLNLVSEDLFYLKDVDTSNMKQLKLDQLEEGDILLLKKPEAHLKSFRKIASKIMDSKFIHSAIVYKKDKDIIYLFQGLAFNEKKTLIAPIEIVKGYEYIIMRPKKKLNKEKLAKLKELEEENMNLKYSYAKVFAGFFERHLEKFLEDTEITTRKRNPLNMLSGVFCSEVVARIYAQVGVTFGFSHDNAMVGPLDILNAPELEQIGYIK